jgi:hypothetical protein
MNEEPMPGACAWRRTLKPSEADLVVQIQEGLRALGYTVLRVGQYRADFAGTTEGTPDLFIGREGWGPVFIGLEVKRPMGRLSRAQKALNDRGMTKVVHDFDEARSVMMHVADIWRL